MNADTSSERYARQTLLPEIGEAGQARLGRARVLVVGAGALGTPALYYLAAAGVGTIGIADDDTLELSNLHRQILFRTEDIGRFKAEAAAERLSEFNPEIRTEVQKIRVTADNAVSLFGDYDILIDATDRLETKFLLNDAAAKARRPLVHAAILGFAAQVAVFDARTGPCLRCLFPTPPETPPLTCSEAGVLGAVPGMAGSLQALEAIKWILEDIPLNPPSSGRGRRQFTPFGTKGGGAKRQEDARASHNNQDIPLCPPSQAKGEEDSDLETLLGRLWLMDGRTLQTRVVKLPRDPACPVCRQAPEAIQLAPEPEAVRHLTPEQLPGYPEALRVDVREDEEWAEGHLEGAVHYPLSRLMEHVPELPRRKDYIVYCAHGIRSETAARLLVEAGYKNVFSLKGGMTATDDTQTPTRTPE
jgi:adenylyltransferase/sulfurtransferase